MLPDLLDLLFGCTHNRLSFPITLRSRASCTAASITGTYVVCLQCGKEFPYDWKTMKIVPLASSTADENEVPSFAHSKVA